MKRLLLFLFFSAEWTFSLAQFGNEWIKFNQEYFKISVARDSLYRLTYSDLQNAGFPVGAVDPRRLQLFHRGVEQAVYVEGESDATFDPGDYIEFFGRRNDGTLDAELYEPSSSQPHKFLNLYNDTTYYFLTYNPLAVLGKRMTSFSEVNVTNIPKETYAYDQRILVLTNQYSGGFTENTYFQKTAFDVGEGWTGTMIREGQFQDYLLSNITNGVSAAGLPQLELMLVGRGEMNHQIEISAGASASSLRTISMVNFIGFATQIFSSPLEWTDIGADGKLTIRVRTLGVSGSPDRISASYIKVRYPRAVSMNGNKNVFRLRENSSGKSYIEVSNPVSQAKVYDVTDPANVGRIGTTTTATLNAVVPFTATERKLFITNSFATPSIRRVGFRFINPSASDFVIISHRLLMRPAGEYNDPVRAYGGYRASVQGGSYDTLVVDVDQLYNQFNYGETSPLAIKKFLRFLSNTQAPKYLFIIGKGLDIYYDYYRNPNTTGYSYFKDLVPSAGYPASDMYYTAGLNGSSYEPAIPTGRITALLPEHVAAYLNKVKEMEAKSYDGLWRKDVLHLSGGINPGEPERFKSYLEEFQSTAEHEFLGGGVKAIPKRSTNIDFINVSDQVNKGLNLITFFGHSSAINIDFDIGYVTDPALGYNNKGKYPMLLLNGCNAGSFFINRTLFGEDWINANNKGAIGFIAHSSFGLEYTLQRYSDNFYKVGYGDSVFIKKGIGDIQKEVARRYMASSPPSIPHISQVQQMVLLGDPAVKLFGAGKPDYEITENDISIESFDDSPVTALSDSFAIKIDVRNFGIVSEDNFRVRVTRSFSDGATESYDSTFTAVYYADTLTFIIRRTNNSGIGENSFRIEIDPSNLIDELNEENNVVELNYFIPLNRTKNLFPYDYAIVNETSVNLRLQTTDITSPDREFLIEFDTVNTFASPFKKEFRVSGKVLAIQTVELLQMDSTAYYWRTKLAEPLPGESEEWEQSSFTFIQDGQQGWAQIHFPQYLKNQSDGLVIDPQLRELVLEETVTSVYVNNFGSAAGTNSLNVSIKLNGAEYQLPSTSTTERVACRNNTINLIAFDKTTTTPYPGIPFKFSDARTCGREPQVIVDFRASELEYVNPETGPEGIGKYIDNIPAGDSVLLFSIGDAGFTTWSPTVKTKLGELGISVEQIESLEVGEPIVIFARKGATPGSAILHRSATTPLNQQSLQVEGTITGRATAGEMTSTLIGPAAAWESLVNRFEAPEPNDITRVDIIGINLQGQQTLLLEDVASEMSLTDIDPEAYPYLRLVYKTQDDLNLTATQLKNWTVLFTPVAEGLLIYKGDPEQMVLQEGEEWRGEYGFVNISDQSFADSLVVRMNYFNKTSRSSITFNRNIKSPAPGDTTHFSFTVQTEGRGGLNDVNVFVNPRIVPEQYYDNNILDLSNHLNVIVDQFNPVLEVSVDGRVLMNGDFVSSDPQIAIRLWDENRVIHKKDTSGIQIILQYPCDTEDCNSEVIYFSRDDVLWTAATDTSDFKINFNPEDLADGLYTLSVDIQDARGNVSGKEPYAITFQVNHESSITLLAPYPNPSAEFFTFTLIISGAQPPNQFSIVIYGTDGRTVTELSNLNTIIGRNEITWNGNSFNGSHLPAGVYFYKITLLDNGKEVPIKVPINTSYLKSGYGKLVLTR